MVDLTVVILTKNEEKNLRKCIESFQGIAKRVVVVDSYSTDHTVDLARKLGADVYQNPFHTHASQFNWGLEHAHIKTAWTMRIDADEELTPELTHEINMKLDSLPEQITGVVLRRRVYFLGRWIKHGGRYPELLLRIFRTGKAFCEDKIMDEHIVIKAGSTTQFSNDLIDNNQKSLEWWINKHNWYSDREVMDHTRTDQKEFSESLEKGAKSTSQAKRKRLIKNYGYYNLPKFLRAHLYFIYRYYIRLGFLDGPEGKIFHFLQAYWYRFLVDAKMYETEKMK
jgi:glycosyltransferase involved in cell wall biosynthesis